MGGWFKKESKSTDDLKGLKLRMAWLGGGSQINTIPISELYIYMAMEMNTIDAVKWVCLAIDINFGF